MSNTQQTPRESGVDFGELDFEARQVFNLFRSYVEAIEQMKFHEQLLREALENYCKVRRYVLKLQAKNAVADPTPPSIFIDFEDVFVTINGVRVP